MSDLALFDHAKEAVAAAVNIDEVLSIRTTARQAEAYAKIAKDRKLLADAQEIIARAERKLGEKLEQAKAAGLLSQGGRPSSERSNVSEPETSSDEEPVFDSTPFTLADIGVDKKLSSRAQKLAGIDDDTFEATVVATREKTLATDATIVSPPKPKTVTQEKPAPIQPLEPRRWHQFAFSVLALTMASDRVSSEAIQKLAEHCKVVELDGEEVEFTPEAIEAMGSLATAALKALTGDDDRPREPREPHNYSHDDRYQRAVEIVRKDGETTVVLLQRELSIGSNLASRLVEWMVRDGVIVSAGEGASRWVLVEGKNESVPVQPSGNTSGATAAPADESDGGGANAPGAADFLERANLREAYEGEVAIIAPHKGMLTMALAEPAMRAGYAAQVPVAIMADDLGHSKGTLFSWANRLSLTSVGRMHAVQKRFGGEA